MKLSAAVCSYVGYKQSMGMRFNTEARTLKSFWRTMKDVDIERVDADAVHSFLAGTGPITPFWERKQSALNGFYRFAIARGYVLESPLPHACPKCGQTFKPYIYSREELRRLLDSALTHDHPRSQIDPQTFHTLLLCLYGAGLRISEALKLTMDDTDLTEGILQIRESKFYKTRLVPIGDDLKQVLIRYTKNRRIHTIKPDSPFFVTRDGRAVSRGAAENAFSRLRVRVGVLRTDGGRYQPRLHDLRHAFAVDRLVSWYRGGADVQKLLPQLATYLGHVHIAATQRYLTLTPELLREASTRFERYAMEVPHE